MADILVGTPCTFKIGDILLRRGKFMGSGRRIWVPMREEDRRWWAGEADALDAEVSGFIIGQRTLSNGDYSRGWSSMGYFGEVDGEPDTYQVTETFQAYLIVQSLRSAPVKVRVEDVTI